MKLSSRFLSLVTVLVLFSGPPLKLNAQVPEVGDGSPGKVQTPQLSVELVSLSPEIARGGTAQVGLLFHLQDHWHVYWTNAGDAGAPPRVKWTLPDGVTAGPLQFPAPSRLAQGPLMDFGYEDAAAFPLNVFATNQVKLGPARLDAHVQWLVCREVCIPGKAHIGLDLNVVAHAQPVEAAGPLGQAILNLPRPLPTGATFSVLGGKKEFVLTLAKSAPQNKADFYPLDTDQIENAALQVIEPTADGVRIHVARASDLKTLPDTLRGVLKISGRNAYEVSATVVLGESPIAALAHKDTTGNLTIIGAVGLAFLGGIILNLMPCVFPVLFLKGLALVQSSHEERTRMRTHGLVYALGILVSFWLIVAVLLVLRASGSQTGWGFQLQSPTFVAILAAGLFFFALSLAGQFDLGLTLTSTGGELAKKEGLAGSFFTGILATIVATPCTAPLMGAAIGFALAQTAIVTFAIFTALALGLALPYLLLTLQPSWTRWLPRPGAWMETMKQITAVPLFATAIWLVWVYGRLFTSDSSETADHMARLLCCLLLIAIAGWTLHKWPAKLTSTIASAALVLIGLSVSLVSAKPHRLKWVPFTQTTLEQARASGHPVLIDFTAAWCLSCQVNERLVLKAKDIESELTKNDYVTMRADWTQYDPEITRQLASIGRSGVPAYVIYPASSSSQADVLPELLTRSRVMEAIQRDASHILAK